jgi:hypothetical protein
VRLALQYTLWAVGLILQVLVLRALLRGPYRRFPHIFVYTVALFLSTVIEVAALTSAQLGERSLAVSWRVYFWIDDAVLDVLVFSVVIGLIRQALERAETRAAIRRWLGPGALLIFAVSFLVHAGPLHHLNAWMTLVSRDLSFAAVILDLLLWSTLIASKKKDLQLLMLSGGLGIQFTGDAIGQSLRQLAIAQRNRGLVLTGNVLVVLTSLVCLYVWWRTFSRTPAVVEARREAS